MIDRHSGDLSWVNAPEICVEVLSPANTADEINQKRELYFEAGALEVWICSWEGQLSFYSAEGKLIQSRLCPDFPDRIVL